MDTVLLTMRWQNILAVWIIVILLAFIAVMIAQGAKRLPIGGSNEP